MDEGLHFYDMASHREMLLTVGTDGHEWLFYKDSAGNRVALRQATEEDIQRIATALDKAFANIRALVSPLPTNS